MVRKVERAEKHIQDFQAALDGFFGTKPYSIRFEDKPHVAERVYYIDRLEALPVEISLIAGDALHNLRSALDHLACGLVESAGNVPGTRTEFPVAWSADQYRSASFKAAKVRGMRQEAIDRIDAMKPYKGGDDTLWRLHALNNVDKHRLLLATCSALHARSVMPSERAKLLQVFRGSHGPGATPPNLGGLVLGLPKPISLKAGEQLYTLPHSELEQYLSLHFEVAFDEPRVIPLDPALGTLQRMARRVHTVILSFDDMLV